jgi:CelD/BcsL family acetyltransferase involved in cellulose biosynthesis
MTIQKSDADYRLSIITLPTEWDEPHLRKRWFEITERSENINALYASPVWYDLLREKQRPGELALAVAYDEGGDIVGVVPVLFKNYSFQYYISRYPLMTLQLKAAHILGSVPMLPAERQVHAQLLGLLLETEADCVYMDTVPVESPLRKLVMETKRQGYLVYAPGGARPWHLLQLPASSEEYLSRMNSKTRSTLKRKAKKLAASGGGKPEMVRIDSEHQVGNFLADAVKVSCNSWQHNILGNRISDSAEERAWGESLARLGLLRSYLLKCGGHPCAFVVGHQFRGVFHYVELGYDRDFEDYSPGTILLHMLIQDLCDHRPPTLLDFGMGDAAYKRRFGNMQREDTSIIAFRKTLKSYLLIGSHKLFRSLVRMARSIVKK